MQKKSLKLSAFIFSLAFFFILALSCSTRANSSSLLNQLDLIDALILQNQNKDALKELKKIEKKVFDPWNYVSIYKRYTGLGERESAEKILKQGLKKYPHNEDLTALYAKFLIEEKRYPEAEEISKKLTSTKYASIYSEAVFRNHQATMENEKLYQNDKYFELFMNAYNVSKNPVWIRDCATFYLGRGLYESAANLVPRAFNDADDAYFWALVNYDAGRYYETVSAAENALVFLQSMNQISTSKTSQIRLAALQSDACTSVAEVDSAQQIRQKILSEYTAGSSLEKNLSEVDRDILPLIVVNTALAFDDEDAQADLLFYAVETFPEYVQGLLAYADFAYNSNLEVVEDDEIVALRKAGISSTKMERYDSSRKIPMSDALYRIDSALKSTKNPYLYIARLDLRYKLNPSLTKKDKTADLWRLLEESATETEPYHEKLVQYTVNFFLANSLIDEATEIYKKYMISKYEFNTDGDFFEQVEAMLHQISVLDLEIAAWFATYHKRTSDALRIYEYCVYESAGIKEAEISPLVTTHSAMNLANIYYSTGKKDKALDLYGRAASFETEPVIRSEIFYRIACIYYGTGEKQNALRSADYAFSINPQNAKAHLQKMKLKD